MQRWVEISGSVGAREWVPPGSAAAAGHRGANEAGNADQSDGGGKGFQLCGRSRAIHACLVGVWCVGCELCAVCGACQAAGSGPALCATVVPRSAQPVVTAVNKLSAATTAMANRHRGALAMPPDVTMARPYSPALENGWKQAVRTIPVR